MFSKINQCGIDQQLRTGKVELLGGIDIYKKVVHRGLFFASVEVLVDTPYSIKQLVHGLRQQVNAVVNLLVLGQEFTLSLAVQADFVIAKSLLAVCGSSNSHVDRMVTL